MGCACQCFFTLLSVLLFLGQSRGLQREETELRDCLRHLQRIRNPAKTAPVIQEAIRKHASTCLSLGASIDHVKDQLQRLCRNELHISEGLYRQALQDAIDLHAELHPALTETAVPSKPTTSEPQPLFNKDTVYHAGICSLAVCTRGAGNYQQFFKDEELVPGHSLTGVSLSRSKQDRYLIARQGDSTVYLGFQSEPLLLEWSKQFKSFGKGVLQILLIGLFGIHLFMSLPLVSSLAGIIAQSEKFPVRFIVDLLNKQQHIVLTGECVMVANCGEDIIIIIFHNDRVLLWRTSGCCSHGSCMGNPVLPCGTAQTESRLHHLWPASCRCADAGECSCPESRAS